MHTVTARNDKSRATTTWNFTRFNSSGFKKPVNDIKKIVYKKLQKKNYSLNENIFVNFETTVFEKVRDTFST